jgi:hypothetical protein
LSASPRLGMFPSLCLAARLEYGNDQEIRHLESLVSFLSACLTKGAPEVVT